MRPVFVSIGVNLCDNVRVKSFNLVGIFIYGDYWNKRAKGSLTNALCSAKIALYRMGSLL